MGTRLHFAKTYKVRYTSGEFNNRTEGINKFLIEHCPSFYGNEEFKEYSFDVEVAKEDFIKLLKGMEDGKILLEGVEDYNSNDMIAFLKDALASAEPDIDYIHLSWF